MKVSYSYLSLSSVFKVFATLCMLSYILSWIAISGVNISWLHMLTVHDCVLSYDVFQIVIMLTVYSGVSLAHIIFIAIVHDRVKMYTVHVLWAMIHLVAFMVITFYFAEYLYLGHSVPTVCSSSANVFTGVFSATIVIAFINLIVWSYYAKLQHDDEYDIIA